MDLNEREKLVYNILLPYTRLNVCGIFIYIRPPSLSILEESCIIYTDFINKYLFDDVLRKSQELQYLQKYYNWNDEVIYQTLPKRIEFAKKVLYESFTKKRNLSAYRQSLKELQDKYMELYVKRNVLSSYVLENIAQRHKLSYQIYACAFTDAQCTHRLFDCEYEQCDGWLLSKITAKYYDNILDESIIRNLVIHVPWSNMWHLRKSVKIFKRRAAYRLTPNQQAILSWSAFYDNVYKSADRPPQAVIEDTDLVDGWMLFMQEKYEKDKKESEKEDRKSHSNEGYVIINNSQDLQDFKMRYSNG